MATSEFDFDRGHYVFFFRVLQSFKGHGYLTAISNPNVLITTVSNESQHSFQ